AASAPPDTHPGGILDDSSSSAILSGLDDSGSSSLVLAGQNGALQPLLNVEDSALSDVHTTLESVGHDLGAAKAVHGVTNLGETTGLGTTGDVVNSDGHANLVTDLLNTP